MTTMIGRRGLLALSALLTQAVLITGCVSMAPRYEQPAAPVASRWRDEKAAQVAMQGADVPAADVSWNELFLDARLRRVIALALDNNRDLRVAALNIERARARYQIQSAELLPSFAFNGSQRAGRVPASISSTGTDVVSRQYGAAVGFSSYELDLFGRIRSLKDEALETFLSTEQARYSTRLSLTAQVAADWLTLAADRQRLALALQTLASQRESLRLTRHQHEQGAASALDIAQVQTRVESARVDAASYTAQVQLARNALELTVGAVVPEALLPAEDAMQTPVALAQIPVDLDSSVLLRRPDVLTAEHLLKAAHADIGAARAAFFPTISLTASTGFGSDQLGGLFSGDHRAWSFAPSIGVPVFNAGHLSASLKVSEVQRDVAVATYEKTIQTAFREVADALAVRATLQERLDAQQALVDASARSHDLASVRYRSGVDSYLGTLDSQRSLYAAQQNLITLQLTERSNRVLLYKALGMGFKSPAQAL